MDLTLQYKKKTLFEYLHALVVDDVALDALLEDEGADELLPEGADQLQLNQLLTKVSRSSIDPPPLQPLA